MAKSIFFPFFIIAAFAVCCGDVPEGVPARGAVEKETKIELVDSTFIKMLGTWTIYEQNKSAINDRCNVCPEIELRANNHAVLTLGDGTYLNYLWGTKENKLNLIGQKGDNKNAFFADKAYELQFRKYDLGVEVKLIPGSEASYILSRHETKGF